MKKITNQRSSAASTQSPERLLWEIVDQDHKSKTAKSWRLFDTTAQRWSFRIMIGCFGITVLLAIAAFVLSNAYLKLVAMVFVLLAQISAIAFQMAQLIPGLAHLRYAAKDMVQPLVGAMPEELKWIDRLSKLKKHELDLIRDSLELTIKHVRSKVGMIVGAVETVGVIPAIGGSIVALHQFQVSQPWFSYIEWAVVSVTILYAGAVFVASRTHKLERYALLARIALTLK